MTKEKNYKIISSKDLTDSEIEIEVEISAEKVKSLFQKALGEISKNIEIPGFRKGKVPQKQVIEKVGEISIWQEAAYLAINEEYPEILKEKNINAIGRPEISITKLAPENSLGFKIKIAVMPEIKDFSYKDIAKKIMSEDLPKIEVSDKEIEDVLSYLKEQQEKAGQKIEIDDKFAQSLGGFKNLEDFKNKIKENLKNEKENQEKNRRKMSVIENIIDKTKIDLPKIVIENELHQMLAQFKGEISGAGMKFEDYLSKINKNEEQIKEDWRPQAVKKAKTQLILNKIAAEENIKPDLQKVEEEVKKVLAQYPGADKERARVYIETVLANESVFEFLENQK